MSEKNVVPIRCNDESKEERAKPPMVLTIFGKRYSIESHIRIVEEPIQRAVPIIVLKASLDRGTSVNDSINIELLLDGNAWGAMIGPNLQEGISGWGDTPSAALRDLATQSTLRDGPQLAAATDLPVIRSVSFRRDWNLGEIRRSTAAVNIVTRLMNSSDH